jgi:hypothetical protein
MGTNGNGQFLESELIHRKVKVGNEWEIRIFPVVGGRLRVLHENNENLSIQTEVIRLEADFAVVKAAVESQKGKFNGTGTASGQRDAKLADSLVELAETRAIARALRFGGIGVEYTSAEEVSHVTAAETESEQTGNKAAASVFEEGNGNGKAETRAPSGTTGGTVSKASSDAIDPGDNGSKPKSGGIGRATQAQCRALYALTKRAQYTGQDILSMLRPHNASTFQDLTRESASQLIGQLQTQVAA